MADGPRLYDDLAHLWPILSPPEDYAGEAAIIGGILNQYLDEPAPDQTQSVLELGAGGGHTLHYLAPAFECVATDLSAAMLKNCRALNPDVHTVVGDMRTLDLWQAFDAVLLHDAADYLATADDARAAITTAARHLDAGGVFILAPTYTSETFEDGESASDERESDGTHVTYTSTVHRTSASTYDLRMSLSVTDKHGSRTVEDVHPCGLFGLEDWRAWLLDAGFDARVYEPDTGAEAPAYILIGVRD